MIHSMRSRSGKNTEKYIVIKQQKAKFEIGSKLGRPIKSFRADPNEIDIIVKTIARDPYPISFSIRMQELGELQMLMTSLAGNSAGTLVK